MERFGDIIHLPWWLKTPGNVKFLGYRIQTSYSWFCKPEHGVPAPPWWWMTFRHHVLESRRTDPRLCTQRLWIYTHWGAWFFDWTQIK